MPETERLIEAHLVRECRKIGGIAEKFVSPGRRGVPDRICQFQFDLIIFVELKAPGKKPTDEQKEDHRKRRKRGHQVAVLSSKSDVDKFILSVVEALQALEALGNLL